MKGFIHKTAAALTFVPKHYVCLGWQAVKVKVPQDVVRIDEFI